MTHKELVRIIYNEFVHTKAFETVKAVEGHRFATKIARKIEAAELDAATGYRPGTLGYQPTGPDLSEFAPRSKTRIAVSASMSHDSHGRATYTAVDNDGNIWTKLADGLWNRQPPLPQD